MDGKEVIVLYFPVVEVKKKKEVDVIRWLNVSPSIACWFDLHQNEWPQIRLAARNRNSANWMVNLSVQQ